ncbi:MAG: NAD(P)/FAD-dependent oxidoreductase [Sedimentisphaerales bacterium]|nr:NAD(P)/FAD-dependent oxidoreductase [Sedimentisphaerales bacterium]
METDICVIGAGPAGMMAAITAAQKSKQVILLESNTTAGRKLLLTGRGRCNLTHTGSIDDFLRAYKPFDRFVRHCIHEFSPEKTLNFFNSRGMSTIAEPGGYVFPKTNRAEDVKKVLTDELKKLNVRILFGKKVNSITKQDNSFIIPLEKSKISARSVIIATGGLSWPKTGSTGDGFGFAKQFGHNIIKPVPALVPLITAEKFCACLAGTGVKNIIISCKIENKKISSAGPMMFTHNGIGGPAVFDFSRTIADIFKKNLPISIDLTADMKIDELDKKLSDCLAQNPRQKIASVLAKFLPKAIAAQICLQENLSETNASQISKKLRTNLIQKLKNFPFTIISPESIERATVTRGGVDTAQIDSKTMQSKLCQAMFFAGEIINVDGPCGGYNLQFAFSSGSLAGKSAVELLEKIA